MLPLRSAPVRELFRQLSIGRAESFHSAKDLIAPQTLSSLGRTGRSKPSAYHHVTHPEPEPFVARSWPCPPNRNVEHAVTEKSAMQRKLLEAFGHQPSL